MPDNDWVPNVGDTASILADGCRQCLLVTVTRVEPMDKGYVRLWTKEYPGEPFEVDRLLVQEHSGGYKGPLVPKEKK